MFKNIVPLFTFMNALILSSDELVLQKNRNKLSDYYTVNLLKTLDFKLIVHYVDDNIPIELTDRYEYDVIIPKKNDKSYDLVIEKSNENFEDRVIIHSKAKYIDHGPYALIRKLDEIKYMVLWLNLYCGVHPDCDKVKLNEELTKMVSSVVLQKQK